MSSRSAYRYALLLGFTALAAWPAEDLRLSGPYTHENLSIFLIHSSAGNSAGKKLLTLQEAMQQKKVVVYETGNVNELAIENLSSDDVFIQSGDIVKGGQQDRVLPDDVILQSKSGRIPISSFCVEHGRWSKRGVEAADQFNASTQAVAGKSLRMAMRQERNQARVWNEVAKSQASLAQAVSIRGSTAALAPASPTSMQLALEAPQVAEAREAYIRDLGKISGGQEHVVGYAYAVNGKVTGADLYSSSDLFQKMWPKLLKASAVEAMTQREKNAKLAAVDASAVRSAMADGDRGRESSKDIAGRLRMVKKESEKVLVFETRDRSQGGWIHKSYLVK